MKTIKISFYELLGKIKNGEYPTIEYQDEIFNWYGSDYANNDGDDLQDLMLCKYWFEPLLEILDEEDEFEDIKEIKHRYLKEAITNYKRANFNSSDMKDICKTIGFSMEYTDEIRDKIDSLIKNQKKIIDKLNKE